MTQLRTLCCNLTLAVLLVVLLPAAPALAAGDDKTTTITSTDTNVKVQLLLGKKDAKGRTLPPIDVPPDPDGHTFRIESQLFGSDPLPHNLYPYDCGDGRIVFAVPGANIDDVCPKEHRKPLAYIPLGGSGEISTLPDGITHLLTITSGGTGAVTALASAASKPRRFRLGGEFGGKFGAKHYSGVNTCGMLQGTAPGGTCSASTYAPQLGVFGGITIGNHLGAFASYNYAFDINRNGTLGTGTERSSFGTQFETITGQLKAPIGPVTPFLEGGIAFLQNRSNENFPLGSGSSSSPLSTHFNIDLTTYTAGGGVRLHDSKRCGAGLFAHYMPARKGMLLNEHNITAGAFFSYKIGK